MKKTIAKILALVLVFAMLVPTAAFAASSSYYVTMTIEKDGATLGKDQNKASKSTYSNHSTYGTLNTELVPELVMLVVANRDNGYDGAEGEAADLKWIFSEDANDGLGKIIAQGLNAYNGVTAAGQPGAIDIVANFGLDDDPTDDYYASWEAYVNAYLVPAEKVGHDSDENDLLAKIRNKTATFGDLSPVDSEHVFHYTHTDGDSYTLTLVLKENKTGPVPVVKDPQQDPQPDQPDQPAKVVETKKETTKVLNEEYTVETVIYDDGSIVETQTSEDGIVIETTIDKDGVPSGDIKITEKAMNNAKGNGKGDKILVRLRASEGNIVYENPDDPELREPIQYAVVKEENGEAWAYILVDRDTEFRIETKIDLFSDMVAMEHWAKDASDFTGGREIFNGMVPGAMIYQPEVSLSRNMIITVLYRLERCPENSGENVFADIADGQWFTEATIWGNDTGVAIGYDPVTFGGADPITREQLATMLYRYSDICGYDLSGDAELDFVDTDQISDWASDAFKWAVAKGLINGREGGVAAPKDFTTRGEAATIMERYIRNVVDKGTDHAVQ